MAIWRMCFTCSISKATSAHTSMHPRARAEAGILIAFPRQKLFRESASVLGFMYVHCLSCLRPVLIFVSRLNDRSHV